MPGSLLVSDNPSIWLRVNPRIGTLLSRKFYLFKLYHFWRVAAGEPRLRRASPLGGMNSCLFPYFILHLHYSIYQVLLSSPLRLFLNFCPKSCLFILQFHYSTTKQLCQAVHGGSVRKTVPILPKATLPFQPRLLLRGSDTVFRTAQYLKGATLILKYSKNALFKGIFAVFWNTLNYPLLGERFRRCFWFWSRLNRLLCNRSGSLSLCGL